MIDPESLGICGSRGQMFQAMGFDREKFRARLDLTRADDRASFELA